VGGAAAKQIIRVEAAIASGMTESDSFATSSGQDQAE